MHINICCEDRPCANSNGDSLVNEAVINYSLASPSVVAYWLLIMTLSLHHTCKSLDQRGKILISLVVPSSVKHPWSK